MANAKIKCYASSLGNCSDKQSAEHYVSRGLWNNKIIVIDGLPWLKGEAKELSVNKQFLKILCETHNKALSPLDREGIKLFRTAEKFHINQDRRGKMKRSAIWKVDRDKINGHKLERLMAKTAVGVLQEYPNERWHLSDTPAIKPPLEVIEAIYGIREFEPPMGIYCVNSIGDKLYNRDHVGINMLHHPQTKRYIGSIISFRDWQFFINLSDISLNEFTLLSATGVEFGKGAKTAIYRIKNFNFNAGAKLSGSIEISW